MNWREGYTSLSAYTYGYYRQMSPLNLKFCLLRSGILPPNISTACELGMGHGLSLNVHAATSDVLWYGNDFLPEHFLTASRLNQSFSGASYISDLGFKDFCYLENLPEFDFIALHGIWSWVSPSNQKTILDFISRRLKPGGVVFISYNLEPGWSAMKPLVDLLKIERSNAKNTFNEAEFRNKILTELSLITKLANKYSALHPGASHRINELKDKPLSYLSHEYLNEYGEPTSFYKIEKLLSQEKLTYACSAHLPDLSLEINYSDEQMSHLSNVIDPVKKEYLKDIFAVRSFRQDYWVKGVKRLNEAQKLRLIGEMNVVKLECPDVKQLQIQGALGEATIKAAFYEKVMSCFSDESSIKIQKIFDEALEYFNAAEQLLNVLSYMIVNQSIALVDNEDLTVHKMTASKLNKFIINDTIENIEFLASPLTKKAHFVSKFDQYLLDGIMLGKSNNDDLISHLRAKMADAEVRFENFEQKKLDKALDQFIERRLPNYKKLCLV